MTRVERREFAIWLENNANRTMNCCDPYSCPLAEYLKRSNPALHVSVGGRCISATGDRFGGTIIEERNKADWERTFTRTVDNFRADGKITGREALVILANIA